MSLRTPVLALALASLAAPVGMAASAAPSSAAVPATLSPTSWGSFVTPQSWQDSRDVIAVHGSTPVITQDMVGQTATLVVDLGPGAIANDTQVGSGWSGTDGWHNVDGMNHRTSGGSTTVSFPVTQAMVGHTVQAGTVARPTNLSTVTYTVTTTVTVSGVTGSATATFTNPKPVAAPVESPILTSSWTGTGAATVRATSRPLTSGDVGHVVNLSIAVDPSVGTIDCEGASYSITSKGAPADIDYTNAGCWAGEIHLPVKVTAAMAGSPLVLTAKVTPKAGAAKTTVTAPQTVDSSKTSMAPVVLTPATPATAPGLAAHWWSTGPVEATLTTRVLTASDLGSTILFTIGGDTSVSTMTCTDGTYDVTYRRPGDTVDQHGWIDKFNAGCWDGEVKTPVKVIPEMVGTTLTLRAQASPVGAATKATLSGGIAIGGGVQKSTVTVTKSASTKPSATASTGLWKVNPLEWSNSVPVGSSRVRNLTDGSDLSAIAKDPIWFGGPSYYKKFPAADKAGWSNPNFFPVATWWDYNNTDESLKADKDMGINTIVETSNDTDARLLASNGISYIGKASQTLAHESEAPTLRRPANFIEDELDGHLGIVDAQKKLDDLRSTNAADAASTGRMTYTNFTALTYSGYRMGELLPDGRTTDSVEKALLNNYTDAVSTDNYWYAGSLCNAENIDSSSWAFQFTKETCRTPQSYGRNMEAQRLRDAADGKVQPTWTFVENMRTSMSPSEPVYYAATPKDLSGAAMQTLIHHGSAIMWFNQSYANDGNAYRSDNVMSSFQNPAYAGLPYKAEQQKLNQLVQQLAPVLNTQSTLWNFGDGIDSMFKVTPNGSYVLAMPTDSGANSGPGSKTFTAPAALKGKTVTVVGENRTIPMTAAGTFTDTFGSLNDYHVYKIA